MILPDASLDQLFRTARTFNTYLDKPVGEDHFHAIWELMKMGPTSMNGLPARLVWCASEASKDKLAALASGSNADKIRKAPACVIIGMDVDFHEQLPDLFPHAPNAKTLFPDPAAREVMALRNSSLQGAYFIMAARALGLATGPMSGFDNAGVNAAFFADTPQVKSNFISTLGYGDPASLHPRSPRPEFGKFNRID